VYGRLKKGMSLKAALLTPVEKAEPTPYEYQGQQMRLSQIAKLTGIKPGTLSNRLKSGKTLEEAISAKGKDLFEYQGQQLTLGQIAKLTGMRPQTLNSRIYRSGWTLEKALSEPINTGCRRGGPVCEFKGRQMSRGEIAKVTGIKHATLKRRLGKGKTLEEAADYQRSKLHTFQGQQMALPEIARQTGVDYRLLLQRVNKLGWSIERATTTPVRPKAGSKAQLPLAA
jgi:hypothetical protein